MLIPGTVLSQRYEILKPLGAGGMGEVYVARDKRLARDVAVKVLPEHALSDPVSLKRFEREAKALAALSHPNILAIHDFGHDQGISYSVTELLKGETLRSRLRGSRLPWEKAVKIAHGVAEGLSAAHSSGIVHRDLKPENVFLTSDDEVKVLDFGLARSATVAGDEEVSVAITQSHLTARDSVMGTVPYMSPEQVRGEKLDACSDIFSFGCTLYEMLAGNRPFQRDTSAEIMTAIMREDPPSLPPDIPPGLQRIVTHSLEKKPENRFQSARDLAFALRATLDDSKPSTTPTVRTNPRSVAFRVAGLVTVIVIVGAVVWFFRDRIRVSGSQDKSIAVLPFENLSESKEDEYFSDGITEDVITQLSRIRELKVISRTSIMAYKHTNKSLREIGRELGAAVILEGSVRRAGDRVRIVGQLINVATDEHIWADTYDRDLKDVFAIQSDVAQKIASALQAQLSPAEKQRIERKPTENLAAYDYYLKGREKLNQITKESNDQAIALFKTAVELDPHFALCYASLADATSVQTVYGSPETVLETAIELSKKALSLDPNLAEGYEALGYAYQFQGRYHQALEMEQKAADLSPNYARAAGLVGKSLWNLGRLDEALPWAKKYQQLDPTSQLACRYVADAYRMLEEYPEAEKWYLRSLAIDSKFVESNSGIAMTYWLEGKEQQFQPVLEKMISSGDDYSLLLVANLEFLQGHYARAKEYYLKLSPDLEDQDVQLGCIYWKEGNRSEAEKAFSKVLQYRQGRINKGSEAWVDFLDIGAIHAIKGDKAEANQWLQKAIDEGLVEVPSLQRNPMFENLRGDPQFQQMVSRMQTKLDTMRRRVQQQSE